MSPSAQSRHYVTANLGSDVQVFATTRAGGTSVGAWDSLNLGMHVDDDPDAVANNRLRLSQDHGFERVQWLNQVHGVGIVQADLESASSVPDADATYTTHRELALAVLTADCLPVVVVSTDAIGVAHCGWRGLAAGILPLLAAAMPGQVRAAWLGPGICGACYQVDEALLDAFDDIDLQHAVADDAAAGKVRLSLPAVAQRQLTGIGCERIERSECCSLCDERFYSYRRAPVTGRMATVVCRS